jgi:MFS family permease
MSASPAAAAITLKSPRLLILLLSTLVVGMGQTVVFAIIPMLGRQLFADADLGITLGSIAFRPPLELAVNAIVATGALTYFLVAPFWGRKSDQWGRKRVIVIGLAGYTLGTVIFIAIAHAGIVGWLWGWPLLIAMMLSRIIHAGILSASFPASGAYIADITSIETRTRGISLLAAANGIGTMCGPALAVIASISFLAPLALHGLLTAIALLLVWRYLPDTPRRPGRGKVSKMSYFDPRYRFYLLIGLVMFTMMGVCQQTLGYYFQDRLGLSYVEAAQYFSIAMMVSSAAMLFAQLVVVQRLAVPPRILLKIGLPIAALGYLLLAVSSSFAMIATSMACFGLGMGLAGPGYSASATLTVGPEEQGGIAGLLAAAPGMGFVIGALLGAVVYSVDPHYPYYLSAIVIALLAAVAIYRLGPTTD